MLQIAYFGIEALARAQRTSDGCIYSYFPGIWLTHPELLKPAGAFPAAAGSPASPPPLGFIKKRARIRVHSSKGNLASIFRPIDDLEESDHIDSGQVFDRSVEGSPNPSAEQRHGIGRAVDEFT